MKCIYWNTKSINSIERILDILESEKPDLLFLSETSKDILISGETEFNTIGYENFDNPGCKRVLIVKNRTLKCGLALQNKYFTTLNIPDIDTYIISIHLPSQMFHTFKALKAFIRDFRSTIDIEIGYSIEKRILVMGDFNVNPHEDPMIDFDGFLATNSINSRKSIKNIDRVASPYYNPTWQLYNRKNFPGTKYYARPSGSSFDILEHHFLDQAVISMKLLEDIQEEKIDVIEKTAKFIFFNFEKNLIEGSDHLPLMFKFKIK